MATVVNDRDVLLLGLQPSQRVSNPPSASIILSATAPAFHVTTSGVGTPSSITITANLISLAGTVAFSATNATVTDNHDNTATVAYSSLTTDSATITASITSNGQRFTKSLSLAKVYDGAAGAQGNPGSSGAPGNQYAIAYLYQWSSTVPSKPSGTSVYAWATGSNASYSINNDGWSVSVPTNPGTPGLSLYVAAIQITAAAGTASTTVAYGNNASVSAWSQNGANGSNGANGTNAITGFLTNESVTLAAANDGTVANFATASGVFKLFDGSTDKTGASVTYSVASQTGCTVSIDSTGTYNVSAMSADSAVATLQGVYGGVTLQKVLTLAKSRAGANGGAGTAAYVVVSTTSQVFSRANSTVTFAPTSVTLTATPYGGTATYQWQYYTGSTWTNVASAGTSPTYTVNSGDFTDTRTYRVQANIGGTTYTDQMTIVQVTGGTNGANGANGVQSAAATIYQWATTIPAGPSGAATYYWTGVNAGTFGAAPANWNLTPGTSPSPGMTLWAAKVQVTDSAANTTTNFNWTSASIVSVGYAGANGTNGTNGSSGAQGASYVTAYCASSTTTTSTTPAQTSGKTSVPAPNDGGLIGTWQSTVPALSSGQYLYQSDGIYDPTTNLVTWSIPYWSSLKVGSLSAITANLGTITAGSLNINNKAIINADGSSTFTNITIGGSGGGTLIAPDGSGAIQNNINSAAGTATWTGITGTGKPQDNATVGADATNFNAIVGGDNLTFNSSFEKTTNGVANGFTVYGGAGTGTDTTGEPTTAGSDVGRTGGLAQIVSWSNSHNGPKGIFGTVCNNGWLPNKKYILSIYAKTSNLISSSGLRLNWNTPPASVTTLNNPPLSTNWQRYSFLISWGTSVEANGLGILSVEYGAGAGNVILDDLMVVEGDVLPAYYASTTEAGTIATWTGIVNTSGKTTNATDITSNIGTYTKIGSGGGKTVISDAVIKIYDGSNALRVQIGDLSA